MKINKKPLYLLIILAFLLSSCQMLGLGNEDIGLIENIEASERLEETHEGYEDEETAKVDDQSQELSETEVSIDESDGIEDQEDLVDQEQLAKQEQIKQDQIDFTRLINKENPIPEDYEFELANFNDEIQVDARIIDDLNQMFADMEAEGLTPTITYGYREHETQVKLFEQGIKKRMNQGMSYEKAYDATSFTTAVPGTSEHEVGLAVDIKEKNGYQNYRLENIYAWLRENAHKYGFILRYDQDKTEITEIMYEPWHYRYVGKEEAGKIKDSGLALEEYFQENQ